MPHTTTNPPWWNDDMTSGWTRVKEALRRDWEQTKRDFSGRSGQQLNQDAGDTLKQAAGKQPIPPPSTPNPPDYEDALRYGWASSDRYRDHDDWDDRLEAKLKQEWSDLKTGRTWDEVKATVRHGWEFNRRPPRSFH